MPTFKPQLLFLKLEIMKFCPKCQTKYDEEIIRFCTKDGAPLVEENPSFTAMPSQNSIDDFGEETLITRNRPSLASPAPVIEEADEPSPRVVISLAEEKKQAVRPLEHPSSQPPPPSKSNTALVVLLTIFGTSTILAGAIGVWWFLSSSGSGAANANLKNNSNIASNNSILGVNYNSNLPDLNIGNANPNINANSNANTNLKSPSPTKTPTPKPSPEANANANVNININDNTIVNISPSNSNTSNNVKTVTPTPSPKPTTPPANTTPQNVNAGVMNSRAANLTKPAYPALAKQMGASGQVVVQILVDESGNVLSAKAISGHSLLRSPAEAAARQSRFNPVKKGDVPVRAYGTLVYNFINQ